MKKHFNPVISCYAFLMFLLSCSPSPPDLPGWVVGQWQNISDSSAFYERWNKTSDSVLSGEAFVIEGGETVFNEKISIYIKGNDLYYAAGVSDQNQGETVVFKLTASTANELIFENPHHDFPEKIMYSKISNDSMVAKISGARDGKIREELFPFSKQQ